MEANGEAAALAMAKALVYEWMPMNTTVMQEAGDGYLNPVIKPGEFWNGIDMKDPVAVEAKLVELAALIGQVAQKLRTK